MVIHVDDSTIAVKKSMVEEIKKAIDKRLSIKDEGRLSKHLGVRYEWNADGSLTMHQKDYIADIITTYEKFGECINFPTPGYPGKCLLKREGESVDVTGYRSFVGKILFAMKNTYPELMNAARELSSYMENPGEEHWKSIGPMVGYLKHEAEHCLRFNRPKYLTIVSIVDSDFATKKDTQKSTTG